MSHIVMVRRTVLPGAARIIEEKGKEEKGMNVIDLFAGCGGLSTGFEMAGYNKDCNKLSWKGVAATKI